MEFNQEIESQNNRKVLREEVKDDQIVQAYQKLLEELLGANGSAGVNRHRWPDMFLPLPPAQLYEVIQRVSARSISDNERLRLQFMKLLLDRFIGTSIVVGDFVFALTARLVVLSLVCALWFGYWGEGWWWLASPVFVAVGGIGGLVVKFTRVLHWEGLRTGYIWSFMLVVCETILLSMPVGMWLKLVFINVLLGLYNATFVSFNLVDIFLSIITLIVAFYYTKQFNTLQYFLFSAPIFRHPNSNERLVKAHM